MEKGKLRQDIEELYSDEIVSGDISNIELKRCESETKVDYTTIRGIEVSFEGYFINISKFYKYIREKENIFIHTNTFFNDGEPHINFFVVDVEELIPVETIDTTFVEQ